MFHEETTEEIRRLHEENAVLKATMEEFKHQLADSLTPRCEDYDVWGDEEDGGGGGGGGSPFEPSFVTRVGGVDAVDTNRETISSLSHPAILWKELQVERKRSLMYKRGFESVRAELDALKEGGIVDKIEHRCMVLGLQVEELTRENVALTKIQKNQEKKLMSDEDLTQDWPVVMASLRQDLAVALDRAERSGKNAGELRKKMRELERKGKEGEKERRDLEEIVRDMAQGHFSGGEGEETYIEMKKTINKLHDALEEGRERERKFAASAKSFMVQRERKEAEAKKRDKAKDETIADLRKKLKDAEVDARQNILNMKELQGTLSKLAVGNLRVKEVRELLPRGGGGRVEGLDLTCIETVLPEEIDVRRTKFMTPKPPTSEVKKQLKWRGKDRGGGGLRGTGGRVGKKGKLSETT
ncbi:hypothetical protein TrCOL_g3587 [Triparma columacea]|uniref:Uncharacterized protein n=1 Tax=Triparma columacea TaxID=722753 RepID=A0A9W7FYE3_9STRA|nr:hypothetical protein TrCOL_g3587 [Triparma columacea]